MTGCAWVTLATNDSYSLGALVLAHSLKKSNTVHKLVVLVTPGVSQSMREQLQSVFDVVKLVDVLDSKDEAHLALMKRPELGITFTKIHCWRLTEFEKCVFLDADTLVVRNCDELFDREEFSAAPDVSWPDCFNSGVFVYRPSIETFDRLLQFAVEKGSFDGGDQGLLNQFFSEWATDDIKKHLPFVYNLTTVAAYSYVPAFKQYGSETRIVHFIGTVKPWSQQLDPTTRTITPTPGSEHLTPLLQKWWDLFCEKVHPSLDKSLGIANGMSHPPVEVCPKSVAIECIDIPRLPPMPEPHMPYREKDDFRQLNLPYRPFDVKGSSGELLNVEFLKAPDAEPPCIVATEEKQTNAQAKCATDLNETTRKGDTTHKNINYDETVKIENIKLETNKSEDTRMDHIAERCAVLETDRQEIEKDTEYSCDDQYSTDTNQDSEINDEETKSDLQNKEEFLLEKTNVQSECPFNYENFFPDETCINNYLEQNVLVYKPLETVSLCQTRSSGDGNSSSITTAITSGTDTGISPTNAIIHAANGSPTTAIDEDAATESGEPRAPLLPRFLTIPQNDKRQTGNNGSYLSASQPLSPHVYNSAESYKTMNDEKKRFHGDQGTMIAGDSDGNDTSGNANAETTMKGQSFEVSKPKSKSLTHLVFDATTITSRRRNTSVWKSQPNVAVDLNRRYTMPKLKPLLPGQPSITNHASSPLPKVTLYTEFLMSSDYVEPINLPKDKIGFVQEHIKEQAELRRSKSDADIKRKFGPVPQTFVSEYENAENIYRRKSARPSEAGSELNDLRKYIRPKENNMKLDEIKRDSVLVTSDPKSAFPDNHQKLPFLRKRKTKELIPPPGGEEKEKRTKKESKAIKQFKNKRKPLAAATSRNPNTNGTANNVNDILKRLIEYSRDYLHYFDGATETNKPKSFRVICPTRECGAKPEGQVTLDYLNKIKFSNKKNALLDRDQFLCGKRDNTCEIANNIRYDIEKKKKVADMEMEKQSEVKGRLRRETPRGSPSIDACGNQRMLSGTKNDNHSPFAPIAERLPRESSSHDTTEIKQEKSFSRSQMTLPGDRFAAKNQINSFEKKIKDESTDLREDSWEEESEKLKTFRVKTSKGFPLDRKPIDCKTPTFTIQENRGNKQIHETDYDKKEIQCETRGTGGKDWMSKTGKNLNEHFGERAVVERESGESSFTRSAFINGWLNEERDHSIPKSLESTLQEGGDHNPANSGIEREKFNGHEELLCVPYFDTPLNSRAAETSKDACEKVSGSDRFKMNSIEFLKKASLLSAKFHIGTKPIRSPETPDSTSKSVERNYERKPTFGGHEKERCKSCKRQPKETCGQKFYKFRIPQTESPEEPVDVGTGTIVSKKPLTAPVTPLESCNTIAFRIATTDESASEEPQGKSGIAGVAAQLGLVAGEEKRSAISSAAHQEYLRKQNWETGNVDYMGRDSFDNIWSKICQTIEGKTLEIPNDKCDVLNKNAKNSGADKKPEQSGRPEPKDGATTAAIKTVATHDVRGVPEVAKSEEVKPSKSENMGPCALNVGAKTTPQAPLQEMQKTTSQTEVCEKGKVPLPTGSETSPSVEINRCESAPTNMTQMIPSAVGTDLTENNSSNNKIIPDKTSNMPPSGKKTDTPLSTQENEKKSPLKLVTPPETKESPVGLSSPCATAVQPSTTEVLAKPALAPPDQPRTPIVAANSEKTEVAGDSAKPVTKSTAVDLTTGKTEVGKNISKESVEGAKAVPDASVKSTEVNQNSSTMMQTVSEPVKILQSVDISSTKMCFEKEQSTAEETKTDTKSSVTTEMATNACKKDEGNQNFETSKAKEIKEASHGKEKGSAVVPYCDVFQSAKEEAQKSKKTLQELKKRQSDMKTEQFPPIPLPDSPTAAVSESSHFVLPTESTDIQKNTEMQPNESSEEICQKTSRSSSTKDEGKQKKGMISKLLEIVGVTPKGKKDGESEGESDSGKKDKRNQETATPQELIARDEKPVAEVLQEAIATSETSGPQKSNDHERGTQDGRAQAKDTKKESNRDQPSSEKKNSKKNKSKCSKQPSEKKEETTESTEGKSEKKNDVKEKKCEAPSGGSVRSPPPSRNQKNKSKSERNKNSSQVAKHSAETTSDSPSDDVSSNFEESTCVQSSQAKTKSPSPKLRIRENLERIPGTELIQPTPPVEPEVPKEKKDSALLMVDNVAPETPPVPDPSTFPKNDSENDAQTKDTVMREMKEILEKAKTVAEEQLDKCRNEVRKRPGQAADQGVGGEVNAMKLIIQEEAPETTAKKNEKNFQQNKGESPAKPKSGKRGPQKQPPPHPDAGKPEGMEELKVTTEEERKKHKSQVTTSKLSDQILKAIPPPRRKAISESKTEADSSSGAVPTKGAPETTPAETDIAGPEPAKPAEPVKGEPKKKSTSGPVPPPRNRSKPRPTTPPKGKAKK